DQAFAWGHFLFVTGNFKGSPSRVPEIRAALTLPANLAPAGQNKSRSREGIEKAGPDKGEGTGVTFQVNPERIAKDTERAGQAVKTPGKKIPGSGDGQAATHAVKGTLMNVDQKGRQLTLKTADDKEVPVMLPQATKIRRNGVDVKLEELMPS